MIRLVVVKDGAVDMSYTGRHRMKLAGGILKMASWTGVIQELSQTKTEPGMCRVVCLTGLIQEKLQ